MVWLWALSGLLALGSAFLAIVLGRNLTRSLTASYAAIAALAFCTAIAGAGPLAWIVAIGATTTLATLQIFGWMLVDVERDHLPPTERSTVWARGLAFVVLGAALGMLAVFARGELGRPGEAMRGVRAADVGAALFGGLREEVLLLGLAIAGALLSALLLLHDEGEGG
jgi:NADH:ubiquinone oxidoreductase subunit 6 (subunit J)